MNSIASYFYPKLARQGYTFQGNCAEEDIEERTRRYRDLGFEVAIESRAYDFNGEEISGMKAILIRKR